MSNGTAVFSTRRAIGIPTKVGIHLSGDGPVDLGQPLPNRFGGSVGVDVGEQRTDSHESLTRLSDGQPIGHRRSLSDSEGGLPVSHHDSTPPHPRTAALGCAGVRRRLARVPHGRLEVIADASHMLHHDQPERLAEILEAFL
jgi:hypothetical protein